MRHTNFAIQEAEDRVFDPAPRAIREIEFAPPADYAVPELAELYVNMESSFGKECRLAIQLASVSPGSGGHQIGLDLVWVASATLGKRALLLTHAMPSRGRLAREDVGIVDGVRVPVTSWDQEFVKLADQEAYVGNLDGWRGSKGAVISPQEIDRHLDELSDFFDMIVIAPPPLNRDPLGTVLARHVDGNIIVVDAERTRRFAAIRLREILTRSGRPIIGAIMSGQRSYLPRWLARLI
jgi:hypothetical protein